jgi:hypothetical protein
VALFAAPIALGLAFIVGLFIGGAWVAVVAGAALAVLLALSLPVFAMFVGRWIVSRIKPEATVHVLVALVVGVLALSLVGWIPVLGPAVVISSMLLGTGALVLTGLRERHREPLTVP